MPAGLGGHDPGSTDSSLISSIFHGTRWGVAEGELNPQVEGQHPLGRPRSKELEMTTFAGDGALDGCRISDRRQECQILFRPLAGLILTPSSLGTTLAHASGNGLTFRDVNPVFVSVDANRKLHCRSDVAQTLIALRHRTPVRRDESRRGRQERLCHDRLFRDKLLPPGRLVRDDGLGDLRLPKFGDQIAVDRA